MSEAKEKVTLGIFTIISQIEQLMEMAPRPKIGGGGGNTKRLVDISDVFDLLGDLKVTIPEDIRRANSVLIEADTLLENANQEALDIVDQAHKEANSIARRAEKAAELSRKAAEQEFEARVAEDTVLLEVQRRCDLLQKHAEKNANDVYQSAKQYADAILQHLQNYLVENYQRVGMNREELGVVATQPLQGQGGAPVVMRPQFAEQPYAAPEAQETAPAPVEPMESAEPIKPAEPGLAEPDGEPPRDEDGEWEKPARSRRRRGLARKMDDGLFETEVPARQEFAGEDSYTPPPAPSRRRLRRKNLADDLELDMDLDD
ncbi:MAG: hypothetical protein LBS18_05025 [Clostridiales bacterium]|jgi:hypothetical protein|nr:hypothetical protein [Clostridiales bacterium]